MNGYITDFAHPDLGMLPIPGYPIRFGSREAGPVSPAPRLGQHTGEVLRELGYTDQDVACLTEKKIIR